MTPTASRVSTDPVATPASVVPAAAEASDANPPAPAGWNPYDVWRARVFVPKPADPARK
jgi:hypothetical protein